MTAWYETPFYSERERAALARSLSALVRATPDLAAWTTSERVLEQQGPLGPIWRRWTPEAVPLAGSSPFAASAARPRLTAGTQLPEAQRGTGG